MAELQDIDGLGPAREESLEEAGYNSVEDVAQADSDQLAEDVDVPNDTALDFVVQAQNLTESDEPEEEEMLSEDTITEEIETGLDEGEGIDSEEEVVEESTEVEEDEESEEEEEEGQTYTCTIEFDTRMEWDTFHAALMRRLEAIYTGNETARKAMEKCLEELDDFDKVEYELETGEFNELHSALLQQRIDYQGDNLIDQMDALKGVEQQVDDQRRAALF